MNKKLIEILAGMAKITDVAALTAALKSETDTGYTIDADGLIINTKADHETLLANVKKAAKTKNFEDAFEIQIRDMKKDTGIEFTGKKQEDFITAFKASILKDANIAPDKKISDLEASLKTLQATIQTKDSDYLTLQNTVKSNKQLNTVSSFIPDIKESHGLDAAEALSLVMRGIEIKDDGLYKDGSMLKNNLEQPIKTEDYVKSFVDTKGWGETQGGRGGGAGAGGEEDNFDTPKTLEDYNKIVEAKGWNPAGQEAVAYLHEVAKDNPDLLGE